MNYKWEWYCPICKNKARFGVKTSGKARINGKKHLKFCHNAYGIQPKIKKITEE